MADQLARSNIRRDGTTREDRKRGQPERNLRNRLERAAWDKSGGQFPAHTCNGKRNKYYEKGATTPGRNV